jgi:hypothetical protein
MKAVDETLEQKLRQNEARIEHLRERWKITVRAAGRERPEAGRNAPHVDESCRIP